MTVAEMRVGAGLICGQAVVKGLDDARDRWHGDRMTSRPNPSEGTIEKQADELTEDDPIPEEVHHRAEALAKAVLRLPPKPQRELAGGTVK